MSDSAIVRKLVCNFVLLFVLIFAACSDKVAGGSTEETSVQASLKNVSVKGLAMVKHRVASNNSEEIGLSLSGMPNGSIVTLYELDSDSLEKTGVTFADTIDNDGGVFNIQGVTLRSPYVWITAVEKEALTMDVGSVGNSLGGVLRVNAFVDVRDTTPITVDVFSDLIAYRARVLMLVGNSYADAITQAKREIFEAFGVYDVSVDSVDLNGLDYYAMRSVFVGIMYSSYEEEKLRSSENVAKAFEQTGSFMRAKTEVLNGAYGVISELKFRLSIPQGAYEQMGEVAAREYQAMLLYEKYLAGLESVMLGEGRCTSELEGKMVDVPYGVRSAEKYSIVCRSGNWHLSLEQVDHTFGTMTDVRDGRVYKTVTIDFGNETQTWMAENLKYNGVELDTTYCLDGIDANCDIYGRLYDWQVATGLGESALRHLYGSVEECIDSLSAERVVRVTNYDSAYVEKCIATLENPDSAMIDKCKYYGGADASSTVSRAKTEQEIQERCENAMDPALRFVDATTVNLDSIAVTQGVCPDGWRIPTYEDWETIFRYIDYRWRSNAEGLYLLAAPSLEETFGFGLYNIVKMEWIGDRVLKAETQKGKYAMIPAALKYYSTYTDDIKSVDVLELGYRFTYDVVSLDNDYREFFVRCIKD